MRRFLTHILLLTAFLAIGTSALAQVVAPPTLLNFQGRLTKPDGTPVANGNYSIRFSLYTALTAGTKLWEQTINPVAVRNGTFAALLNVGANFQNGATADTLFNGDLFLEIKIGTAAALTPRRQLASVAYAMKANMALTVPDGSITGAKILDGTITSADIANGTITGADIANGTITANKLAGSLSVPPSGPAGGDLAGTYPNPELKTVASSLYKVSGTLMSALQGGSAGVDLQQNTVTAQNQDEAWESFKPTQTGNLTAFDFYIGTTTGVNKTIPLTVYAGEGTTGGVLGSVSITVTPAMGFQNFTLAQPIPVTAGQTYTVYIGRSASLQFGYTSGDPYPGGKSDIGDPIDYAFRTYMNTGANGRVAVNGDFSVNGKVGIGTNTPTDLLTILGAGTAISALDGAVRTRLFSSSATGKGYIGTGSNHGLALRTNDTDRIYISPEGNTGIGTNTPEKPLHLGADMLLNNGTTLYAKNQAGTNEVFMHPRWSDNKTYLNFGVNGFNIRNNASASVMFMQGNGNVGIGTTTPGAKLEVNGNTNVIGALNVMNGNDFNLYGNGNDSGDVVFRDSAGGQLGRIWSQPGGGALDLSPRADSGTRAQVNEGGLSVFGNISAYDVLAFTGSGENGADTGIWHNADGRLALMANSQERIVIQNGNTYLQGEGNYITGSGLFIFPGSSMYIFNLPFIGDWHNVQWNGITGQLGYDDSTRRHKENIRPIQDDFMKLLLAEGKTYTRPGNPNRWEIGFIAEEMEDIGLKNLVEYEADGKTPSGYNYEKTVVYLTEIAKIQQKQIEAQKQKIETLEKKSAEVDALKAQMETLMQRLEQLEHGRK